MVATAPLFKNVQQVHAARFAFAAILADGSVVTWGDPTFGGDSSAVQDQLKTVQHIQATGCAFAAIRGRGGLPQLHLLQRLVIDWVAVERKEGR